MPYAHLKEIFGTLRFRLTLWNTTVVLLMVVVTLWGVREGLRFTLLHEADNQLKVDATEIRLTIEQLYPDQQRIHDELDRKAISHVNKSFFIRLYDHQNVLLWSSVDAPTAAVPIDPFLSETRPISVDDYRLVHVKLAKKGIPNWTICVGSSYQPLESDVGQLTNLMLVVGAVVLLVSPLGGYWLAGRATRPLAEIIDTTAQLHPSSLEQRLPLRGTRDELDRLSATINGFLDRIAAFVDQNREFTANAAHELRSPLAAIQSSLEVALNSDRTISEYKDLLLEVLEECGELGVLVNQLLLLAESDAGHLQIDSAPIHLDEIVRKGFEMFQGVAEAEGIDLAITRLDPIRLEGDSGRLRQVINNLIDNAIKFTRQGGKVEIDLALSLAGDRAVLSVKDTGLGISREDLLHVFDRFYRGDRARHRGKERRGTGLGLSICESIVASHGGQIHIDSVINQGTTVCVSLPVLPKHDLHTSVGGEQSMAEYAQAADAVRSAV